MEKKTLGVIARDKWRDELANSAHTPTDSWQAVADAVLQTHEARRWQAIESAGVPPLLVGKWHRGRWVWKQTEFVTVAIEDGYTHWAPIPAPPQEVLHVAGA